MKSNGIQSKAMKTTDNKYKEMRFNQQMQSMQAMFTASQSQYHTLLENQHMQLVSRIQRASTHSRGHDDATRRRSRVGGLPSRKSLHDAVQSAASLPRRFSARRRRPPRKDPASCYRPVRGG